jgi:hypothetical protein
LPSPKFQNRWHPAARLESVRALESTPSETPAMQTNEHAVDELTKWSLANARFSAFSNTYTPLDPASFEQLFGFPFESETTRKAQLLTEFSAKRGQTVYTVSVAGPKIDVTVSSEIQLGDLPTTIFPVLSDPAEATEHLRSAARWIIQNVHGVRRLAVGEQRLLLAASRVEAYNAMAQFLPSIQIDADNSSDFFYRINRPRSVNIGGHTIGINRLTQWVCLQLNVVLTAAELSKTAVRSDAVSVITDVNTKAEDDISSFSVDEKNQIVDKLFAFSLEISKRGDHP